MTLFDKKFVVHSVILWEFLDFHGDFGDHLADYTDGTNGSDGVAAVALEGNDTAVVRPRANAAASAAELRATPLALHHDKRDYLQHSVVYHTVPPKIA